MHFDASTLTPIDSTFIRSKSTLLQYRRCTLLHGNKCAMRARGKNVEKNQNPCQVLNYLIDEQANQAQALQVATYKNKDHLDNLFSSLPRPLQQLFLLVRSKYTGLTHFTIFASNPPLLLHFKIKS